MAVLAECPFCHRRQSSRSKRCASKNGKGCGADLEKARRSNKVKYWIAYRLPGGKQRSEKITGENATSVEYARAADAKRKVQKRENRIFDIKPESKMTFQELTNWYLGLEKMKALASYSTLQINLNSFNKEFGNIIVANIKPVDLENYQAKRKGQGLSDSYIDHEVGAARGVVNKAFDNDLVGGDVLRAFKKVKKLLKHNSNARDKVITLEQFKAVMEGLPVHIRGIVAMAFYTGMRRGEILSLTWDKVDLENRIIRLQTEDTKERKPKTIPICQDLYEILKAIPRASHDDYVFLYKGKPLHDIRRGLRKGCRAAEIDYGRDIQGGFIFHDLRHTFNTLMRKAGVSASVRMRITGHSTPEMDNRYDTVDLADMRGAVDQMTSFLASVDQNVDQKWN